MRRQFIDASNNSRSNLTQIKRHVMQEYMRQKRSSSRHSESKEQIDLLKVRYGRSKKRRAAKRRSTRESSEREQNSESPKMPKKQCAALSPDFSSPFKADFSTPWSEIAPSESHPQGATPVAESATSRSPQSSPVQDHGLSLLHNHADGCLQNQSFSPQPSSFASWPSAPVKCLNVDQSPRTIPSAARIDPFNAPPMDLDLEGQKSFDFYANDLPAFSYGTHSRLPKTHNGTALFRKNSLRDLFTRKYICVLHTK